MDKSNVMNFIYDIENFGRLQLVGEMKTDPEDEQGTEAEKYYKKICFTPYEKKSYDMVPEEDDPSRVKSRTELKNDHRYALGKRNLIQIIFSDDQKKLLVKYG